MSFQYRPDFRIILHDSKKLMLPKTYVEKYWEGISNPIFLKFPNGVQQEIFWVERDGEIWFQKNWENIAKFLKYGYVLTFKYIVGSYFKVKIFGVNALEINYSNIIKCVNEEVVEDVDKDKEIVEVSDESEEESDDEYEIIAMKPRIRTRNDKRKFNMDLDTTQQKFSEKAKKYPTIVAGDERANNEYPFFEVKLTPSYVNGSFLGIPTKFSREYLNKFEGTATIRVGDDEKTMEVNVRFEDGNKRSILTTGWKLLSKIYNLQVDDVCKFVMTQHRPLSFTIIISRARKGPSPKKLLGYKEGITCDNNIANGKEIGGNSRSLHKVYFFDDSKGGNTMKHNTFKILVKNKNPNVPKEFMNIGCHDNNVELKMRGQSWSVKVNYCPSIKGSRFSAGWRQFAQECNVEIGDTCLFELIDKKKFVFNVSIVGKNH
ncbi:B3 domain-containing transcription factor VRN1 [Trifolium repens]|nr:B3 domain-containing transcription factor VRN1 [Trifolium repens]